MHAVGDVVRVGIGADASHHISGVKRCGSPWVCPVCAPTVRERRAAEIDLACAEWVRRGGSVYFMTATVPHSHVDSLTDTLGLLTSMWSEASSGRSWATWRKANGVVGVIRSVEITYGDRNGWHPHIHALLFVAPGVVFDGAGLALRWRGRFDAHGIGGKWVPHVSADVRPVDMRDRSEIGGYLAKVQGGWGAGLELARGDLKRGGVTADQLLELASTGQSCWVELWAEYERATKGRRFIVWSRGLRAEVGVDGISDEEAAAGPELVDRVAEWAVPAKIWAGHVRRGTLGSFLWDLVRCHGPGCVLTRGPTATGPPRPEGYPA